MEDVYENIEDVKCPVCGNPVNWKYFTGWFGEDACFIAECWSGDTDKDAPQHLFKIWVKIDEEVRVIQKEKEVSS